MFHSLTICEGQDYPVVHVARNLKSNHYRVTNQAIYILKNSESAEKSGREDSVLKRDLCFTIYVGWKDPESCLLNTQS